MTTRHFSNNELTPMVERVKNKLEDKGLMEAKAEYKYIKSMMGIHGKPQDKDHFDEMLMRVLNNKDYSEITKPSGGSRRKSRKNKKSRRKRQTRR